MICIDFKRRRVWLGPHHLHHGEIGAVLALFALALLWHDRSDRKLWFRKGA